MLINQNTLFGNIWPPFWIRHLEFRNFYANSWWSKLLIHFTPIIVAYIHFWGVFGFGRHIRSAIHYAIYCCRNTPFGGFWFLVTILNSPIWILNWLDLNVISSKLYPSLVPKYALEDLNSEIHKFLLVSIEYFSAWQRLIGTKIIVVNLVWKYNI